ncbi:type II secretion system ATPase GspE [Arenicella xantha]|uniref:Type II secretion system protein E n=1 Tax=Arenicella xantha TaxID=644221 RepID=A0A395JKX9_9GAMM|nr:type II secretion system ATPase GspE [Arenicella xantha]RBP51361.1 type II secretion system protein E (GspE) [Arenicella xantha]
MNDTAVSPEASDIEAQEVENSAALIPYAYAKKHNVLVNMSDDGVALVTCVQTPKLAVLSELKRRLNARLTLNKVIASEFDVQLRSIYDTGGSRATKLMDDMGDDLDLERLAEEMPQTTDLLEADDDAPIIRLINALLTQAIRENASDIHLEAFEESSVVRFRVDGVLRDILSPRREMHSALVSRIKVMSKLDIAEKRLPQDGRMSLRVAEHPVDVRVSTLPTQHGERVVLRLLDKQSARLDLEKLGMPKDILLTFEDLIRKPNGILLVTGPTGSGKTTTLYSGLHRLDRKRLNILTVEDPVEYDLDGVGQTQMNSKIGLTFAGGLRSILRQDPDVVLVGEIRDLETAEISVQASLTGHLVLSTLHTNTAVGAVTRLVDMGVEPFLIASSLVGVLAQRLVRRLCPDCKQPHEPDSAECELLGIDDSTQGVTLFKPQGCPKCEQIGYRGRLGIYELVEMNEGMRRLIHDQASEDILSKHARKTSRSLMHNGFDRVLQGETTVDEVFRVTQS